MSVPLRARQILGNALRPTLCVGAALAIWAGCSVTSPTCATLSCDAEGNCINPQPALPLCSTASGGSNGTTSLGGTDGESGGTSRVSGGTGTSTGGTALSMGGASTGGSLAAGGTFAAGGGGGQSAVGASGGAAGTTSTAGTAGTSTGGKTSGGSSGSGGSGNPGGGENEGGAFFMAPAGGANDGGAALKLGRPDLGHDAKIAYRVPPVPERRTAEAFCCARQGRRNHLRGVKSLRVGAAPHPSSKHLKLHTIRFAARGPATACLVLPDAGQNCGATVEVESVGFWSPPKTKRLVAALTLGWLSVFVVGCGNTQPSGLSDSPTQGHLDPRDPCATPNTGCQCAEPQRVVECGNVQRQAEGQVWCSVGHRTCGGDKTWGDCQVESLRVQPATPGDQSSQALGNAGVQRQPVRSVLPASRRFWLGPRSASWAATDG